MDVSNSHAVARHTLNESPSEKEGKLFGQIVAVVVDLALNESPSEKEGKSGRGSVVPVRQSVPSMKVPPKRKGNPAGLPRLGIQGTLNESPSEKEGKYGG